MLLTNLFGRARQLVNLPRTGRMLARLFVDGRVPNWLKFGAIGAALLIISPLDLFSDIPFLGPLDDFALLMLLAQMFIAMSPREAVAEANGIATMVTVKDVTPRG